MSRTGVGIRVLVDGLQLDDGCLPWTQPSYPDRMPWGLSADEGLKITWGRSSTMEQPAPSSCTFQVTDDPGNLYFNSFRIGSRVSVIADATISGGATLPAFKDPDFESELRAVTSNATAGRGTRRVETGTQAAWFKPVNADGTAAVQLPPDELQPPEQNPNAWDDLPHLGPGQSWDMQVRLWVPQGVTARVRPVVYTGPYADAAEALAPIGTITGSSAWATVSGSVSPGVQLGWLGVQVESTGGLTWAQVPAGWQYNTEPPASFEWGDFLAVWVDRVEILAPPDGAAVSQLVFGGRITDLESQADGDSPIINVTATDFLGDLGNRFVGDEPWLKERLDTRFRRVLQLAHAADEPAVTADIAPTVAAVLLTWEDVDHRAASGLLTDMATSVDGVLWSATHLVSGPFVKLEDPGQRPSLYQLGINTGTGKVDILPIDPSTLPPSQRPLDISACDVLRDPVRFVLDVSDIATRATITWADQTLNDEGQPAPTERTVAVIDGPAENEYGTRNVSVQTMLTTAAEAQTVAERLLARSSGQWRMEGLQVSDADIVTPDQTAVTLLLSLLDGVTRGGLPLRVTELPTWSPMGSEAVCYLEGGEYSYTGGGWQLALTVSRATGLGTNAQWDELPRTTGWTWDNVTPGITWDDLRGVAAP